jgi:hypothetical protein
MDAMETQSLLTRAARSMKREDREFLHALADWLEAEAEYCVYVGHDGDTLFPSVSARRVAEEWLMVEKVLGHCESCGGPVTEDVPDDN